MTKIPRDENPLDTLRDIRTLMERSSRFISLSGLSGITAGLFAIAGAVLAYLYLGMTPFEDKRIYYEVVQHQPPWGLDYLTFFVLDALFVLSGALAGGIFFTTRKARRRGQPIWDALSQRLLINLSIPLIAGGLFVCGLYYQGQVGLIAPAMLTFYGLALINASKYTLNDIRFLGLSEVGLGLTGLFFPGYGLELWTLGFGLLHIAYGILMYIWYESPKAIATDPSTSKT
jgi:hypothetical protein